MTTSEQWKKAMHSLLPLANIWQAYLDNELDDEARRFWGKDNENENQTNPYDIEIYSGRGGKSLLNLGQCREAAAAVAMLRRHNETR